MIFQNTPVLDGNEKEYVLDCLDTNWISSMGKYIGAFEKTFSAACGAKHGVACSNGTAALHLALVTLDLRAGDEVIVPDFTLIADANMVVLAGAKPVFVDVDPETWCLDINSVRQYLTPNTRAIIAVHMYGHPCDMDALRTLAREHDLFLIEDAAQAHGTEYQGARVGSLGDMGCFSFYASKTLTSGEGGMVLTNSDEYAERLRDLRNQGFEGDSRTYVHRLMGFNYRLTNLQAAIGLAQTERMEDKIAAKRRMAETYHRFLGDQQGLGLQAERAWAKSSYWNFTIVVEESFGCSRDAVVSGLDDSNIQTRLPFKPLHAQPVYMEKDDPRYPETDGRFPVSERLGNQGLCLPSGLDLTENDIAYVCRELLALRGTGR